MGAEREINITEFSDDYYTEPKKKKSKRVKVDNPWESELATTKSIPKKTHFNSPGNGLLRVEIPLREDITTDVEIQ